MKDDFENFSANQIECSSDLNWILTEKYPLFFDEGVCLNSDEKKARYFYDLRKGDGELNHPPPQ